MPGRRRGRTVDSKGTSFAAFPFTALRDAPPMISQNRFVWTAAGALGLGTLALSIAGIGPSDAAQAAPAAPAAVAEEPTLRDLKPVETDMHEYMEYVNQPAYKRLKAAMGESEKNGKAWSGVKSDSLILAESANLVQLRGPKGEDRDDWIAHSVGVRETGGKLYRSAKDRDDEAAQKHYRAMIKSCNDCHEQFAGGEHILSP